MGTVGGGGRHLEEVIRATEERAIDAQGSLGICYATLRCPDLEKSRHWYLQAALQGNTQAMYEIGLTLLLGEGGEADPEQAVEWLEKAAMTSGSRQVLAEDYLNFYNAKRLHGALDYTTPEEFYQTWVHYQAEKSLTQTRS